LVKKQGVEKPHVYEDTENGGGVYATLNLPSSQVKADYDRGVGDSIWSEMKKQGVDPKKWLEDRKIEEGQLKKQLTDKFEKALMAVHNFAQGEVIQAAEVLKKFDHDYLANLKGEPVQASIKLAENPWELLAYTSVYPGYISITLNLPNNQVRAGSLSGLGKKIKEWSTEEGLDAEQRKAISEQFENEIEKSKDKLESEISDKISRALKAAFDYAQGTAIQYENQMENQAEALVRGQKIEPTAAVQKVSYDQSELDFSLTGAIYVRIRFPKDQIIIDWGTDSLFKDFIDQTTEMENTERGKAMDAMQIFMHELGKERSAEYSERLRKASTGLYEYARGLGNAMMSELKAAFTKKVEELKGSSK